MSHMGRQVSNWQALALTSTSPDQLQIFRNLGRWKVLSSSIFGMQEAMKMRWGDSKNLQKRDRSSCVSSFWNMLPSMVWKRDHQVWNVVKHWETRLKRGTRSCAYLRALPTFGHILNWVNAADIHKLSFAWPSFASSGVKLAGFGTATCFYSAALSRNRPVAKSLPDEVTSTSPHQLQIFRKMKSIEQ